MLKANFLKMIKSRSQATFVILWSFQPHSSVEGVAWGGGTVCNNPTPKIGDDPKVKRGLCSE